MKVLLIKIMTQLPYQFTILGFALMFMVIAARPATAQEPEPKIDQLAFKFTHNSYFCNDTGYCPLMHHHPVLQIDDFGVWGIELDFSIKMEAGQPRAIIGHDWAGSGTHVEWGKYLEDYLRRIRNEVRALPYRPLFLILEKKNWGNSFYHEPASWINLVHHALINVFGVAKIYCPADLRIHGGQWPTVSQMGDKVVPILLNNNNNLTWESYSKLSQSNAFFYEEIDSRGYTSIYYKDNNGNRQYAGLKRRWHDVCVGNEAADTLENEIVNESINFLAVDEYQYDWTFLEHIDQWAPPDPIVVDWKAYDFWTVKNDNQRNTEEEKKNYGNEPCWDTDSCTTSEFTVSQHGTFGFPYDTVREGINHAKPGWTVLIRAGSYNERFTITKCLTLKADGGIVVIGSR